MNRFKHKLEQQIDALLVDMAEQRVSYKKTRDFRVSSLPFCPIRTFLYEEKSDSYNMDFYTSIGTAVHNTVQKWIALGGFKGKVFACWKAVETGEIYGPCFLEDLPKKWAKYRVVYEEITIQYDGLSGHVDLVIEIFPGKYIVIDFKTTDLGVKKLKYPNWKSYFPASRSSIIQISVYSTLLRELYKLNIVAWCLVYVDRSKVISSPDDYHKVLRPWNERKHDRMLEFIDQACENNKRLLKLQKIINYADGFSKNAEKVLHDIVRNRPCTDETSYDNWMDYGFYQGYQKKEPEGVRNKACAHKDACLTGNKACLKSILSKL